MKFEALYYDDRLVAINPSGDVGIVTLWSRTDQLVKTLNQLGINLSNNDSRIAVIGNLFGNGLPHLLRNLLWNPQIAHLIICGSDLSGSRLELVNFLKHGVEETTFLASKAYRIVGTTRIIDNALSHKLLNVSVYEFGGLSESETKIGLINLFYSLPPAKSPIGLIRRNIPLVNQSFDTAPSNVKTHVINETTPLEAWKALIARIVRFGVKSDTGRYELNNVHVLIEKPQPTPPEALAKFSFDYDHFKKYQQFILNATCPADQTYSYGSRLRGHFKNYFGETIDSLEEVVIKLKNNLKTRHAYVSLWDNNLDLCGISHTPCLVSIFFRVIDEKLTLTATFRTHNAMDAWLENVHGLVAIMNFICERTLLAAGSISIFSHSMSISHEVLNRAKSVSESYHPPLQPIDSRGHFNLTTDGGEIVVQHYHEGALLGEFRGKTAKEIERQLILNQAVSEVSHALYLGRELFRLELKIKQQDG